MTFNVLLAAVGFIAVMSLMAFAMAVIAWIEVKAMQKSTHSIQYIPAGTDFEKVTKDLEEKLNKDIFEAV
jgi:hypothetical protein